MSETSAFCPPAPGMDLFVVLHKDEFYHGESDVSAAEEGTAESWDIVRHSCGEGSFAKYPGIGRVVVFELVNVVFPGAGLAALVAAGVDVLFAALVEDVDVPSCTRAVLILCYHFGTVLPDAGAAAYKIILCGANLVGVFAFAPAGSVDGSARIVDVIYMIDTGKIVALRVAGVVLLAVALKTLANHFLVATEVVIFQRLAVVAGDEQPLSVDVAHHA